MTKYFRKYFADRELRDKETLEVVLADGFGERLDALREAWGKPLYVNSCCRSAARNARIGGHPKSLHVYDHPFHPTGGTCAVDFRLMDAEATERFKLLALEMGFSVGDEPDCIHVDDRTRVLGLAQSRFTFKRG